MCGGRCLSHTLNSVILDQFLFPIHNVNKSFVINTSNIPRHKPAIRTERLLSGLWIAKVPTINDNQIKIWDGASSVAMVDSLHDGGALDPNLSWFPLLHIFSIIIYNPRPYSSE